ncbi:hypothetical protein ACIO8G_16305 [Streptomyces sp. NPDC087219]|uniref:hypothetical protein n=1 Tax=Streptomyces sp. NPDC087219 TaxID=3365770 RepID=UPI0037FC086F
MRQDESGAVQQRARGVGQPFEVVPQAGRRGRDAVPRLAAPVGPVALRGPGTGGRAPGIPPGVGRTTVVGFPPGVGPTAPL